LAFLKAIYIKKLSTNFSAVIVTTVVLQTRDGRLLSIEIPSDVTFAQRRGWADNTLWADNTYFPVISANITVVKIFGHDVQTS